MASDESSDDGQPTYVNDFEDPTVESVVERFDRLHLEEHQMQISEQGDGALSPTTVGAVAPTTVGAVNPTTDGVGDTGHYQSEIAVEGHHLGVMGQNLDNAGSTGHHLCDTFITGNNPGGTGGVEYSGEEHFQTGTAVAGHCQGGTGNNPGDVVRSGYDLVSTVIPGTIEHKPGGKGDVEYNPSGTVSERASVQKLVIEELSACDFLASQYGNLFLRETEDIHKCKINVIDKRKKSLKWENRPFFYDGWCQTNSNKRVTIVLGHLCDLESRMIVIPSDRCLCPAQGFENCFRDDKDIVVGECLKHLGINEKRECRKANLGDCFYNVNTGSLPYSIICHAVFIDNGISKRKACTKKNLSEVLGHAVQRAEEGHLNSIAIPLCQYGGPTVDDQISAIKETIKQFLTSSCFKNTKLEEIFLCVMDKKDADLVQKKMEKLFRKVDEKSLARLMFKNVSRKFKGLKMRGKNSIRIEIKFGQLHEVNAEVLVNTTGPDLDLKNGSVSAAILAAAGPDIQQECREEKSILNLGDFVITGPGMLKNCKKIFHGALPMWDPTPGKCEQILKGFMEQCLLRASREGVKSIAFPSLGTGNLKFPWHQVAKAMYESVDAFEREKKNTALETVLFVIFPEDKMSKEAFFIEEKRNNAKMKLKMQQLPIQQCRNDEETLEGVLKSSNKTVKMKVCQGDMNQEPFDCTLIWLEKCDHDDGNCPVRDAQYYSAVDAFSSSSKLHNEFRIHSKDEEDQLYRHFFVVFREAMLKRHTVLSIQVNRGFSKLSAGAQAEQIIKSLNHLKSLEHLLEVHIYVNSSEDLTSVQSCVGAITLNKPGFLSSVVGLHTQFDYIKLGKTSKQTCHYPQPPFEVIVKSLADESCEAALARIRKHLCESDIDTSDEIDDSIISVFEIVKAEVNPGFLERSSEVHGWQLLMDSVRTKTKVEMTLEGERLYIAGTLDQVLFSERELQLLHEQEQLKFEDGHFQDETSPLKIQATFIEYMAVLYILDKGCDLGTTQISYEGNCIRISCNRENVTKLKEIILNLLSEVQRSNWEEILLRKGEEITFDLPQDDMVMIFNVKNERKIILFSKSTERVNLVKHKIMLRLGRTAVTNRKIGDQTSPHTSMGTDLSLSHKISTKQSESTFFTENRIMIKVYSMPITKTNVECIVNATDVHLRNLHGVSKAIADAAGKEFKQACENHILVHGKLKKNQPVVLSAGSLKYSGIINIAGPVKCKKDDILMALSHLECIIVESLKAVELRGFKSVALPSISADDSYARHWNRVGGGHLAKAAGLAGMQSDLCAQQYFRAVDKFSKQAEGPLNLQEIHFVDINKDMTQVIQTIFAKHFSSQKTNFPRSSVSGSQSYTSFVPQLKEKEMFHTEYSSLQTGKASCSDETNTSNMSHAKERKDGNGMCYLNETAIKVTVGDICDIKADALVSLEDENGSGKGRIAQSLLAAAGRRYQDVEHPEVKMARRSVTEVVITGSGQLSCQFVLHAIAPEWSSEAKKEIQTFQKNVTRTMINIMDAAFEQKLKSFAVPLIGTSTDDKYEEPLTNCCESMIDGLDQWIQSHSQEYQFDEVILICSNEAASQCFMNVLHAKLEKEDIEKGRLTGETLSKPSDFQSKSDANTTKLSDSGSKEDCVICMESITDPKVLPKCGHTFCKECIDQQFKYKPVCPCCGVVYGKITGIQPDGTMQVSYEKSCLPGFEMCGTIVIFYEFNGGTQKEEHPRPGKPYGGTKRKAYLPDNDRGKFVLRLLREAFKRRLVFTIGTSRTTGQDDTVTWNDIHHKTNRVGGPQKFGYPDETYLDRVTEELAVKGITKESLE